MRNPRFYHADIEQPDRSSFFAGLYEPIDQTLVLAPFLLRHVDVADGLAPPRQKGYPPPGMRFFMGHPRRGVGMPAIVRFRVTMGWDGRRLPVTWGKGKKGQNA